MSEYAIVALQSRMERETGLEPAALCLGSRCATIAPFPRSDHYNNERNILSKHGCGTRFAASRCLNHLDRLGVKFIIGTIVRQLWVV